MITSPIISEDQRKLYELVQLAKIVINNKRNFMLHRDIHFMFLYDLGIGFLFFIKINESILVYYLGAIILYLSLNMIRVYKDDNLILNACTILGHIY